MKVVTHISWHIVGSLSPSANLGKHGAAVNGRPAGRKQGAGEWADLRFRLVAEEVKATGDDEVKATGDDEVKAIGDDEVKATGDDMLIHEALVWAIREGSDGFDKAIIVKTLHSSSSSSSEMWL